jgi:DNA-binding FrmR family transcriptional regulator
MTNETRINIIIGQLEGIKKMLASGDNNSCTDLIIQLKAVKSALSSLLEKIVSEEMGRCLIGQKKDNQDKMLKMLKELINK